MPRRLYLFALFLSLLGCAFAGSASGAARFYTPDYGEEPVETIGGFDLGTYGSLSPIPGSPFPASDPGSGGLWGLAFTPDGSRAASALFYTGGVWGYRVPPSGIFERVNRYTDTASATSVAITPDGRYAFVPTRDFNGKPAEGIHRFSVNADGSLSSLGPPVPVGGDSNDVAISPNGRFLFAEQGNAIARFAIGGDGSLAPLGSVPAPGARNLATSADERYLYVFIDGGGEPGVAVFAIGADGSLEQRGSTVTLGPGSSADLFAVSPNGRFAFIPDGNNEVIATVTIADDGTPAVLPGGMPVLDPESVGVSADGRYLIFYRGGGSENALGTAAINPDGSLTKTNLETPWSAGEPERIVFQPQPTPVAKFSARAAAPRVAIQFDASATTGAARYDWDFGDQSTFYDGGPTPTHAYLRPGVYTVTLTTYDRNGCGSGHVYNGQSTVCPGGSTTITTQTIDTLPVLGKPKATPKKFRAKPKGKAKGKFGTTFRYTVSEGATVRFKFERKKVGRLVGGKCKSLTKKNASRKKCPIFKLRGSRDQRAKAGANKLKWNGNLKGKPLAPGSYRATVVATDDAGGRSAPQTVGFRILPPPKQP